MATDRKKRQTAAVPRKDNIFGSLLPVWLPALIFVVIAAVLMTPRASYFWKLGELSFFVPDGYWLAERMALPGGGLDWLAGLLSQLFFYPALGCCVLVGLLLLLAWLSVGSFRLKGWKSWFAWVAPLMLLCWSMVPGYTVYWLKTFGPAFNPLLGIICVVLIFRCFRDVESPVWNSVGYIVAVCVLYPLLGFYALLGVGCAVFYGIVARGKKGIVPALSGIAAIALLPYIYYEFVYVSLPDARIYTAQMPRFYGYEKYLAITVWISCFWTFLFSTIAGVSGGGKGSGKTKPAVAVLSVLFYAGAAAFCIAYIFRDANFDTLLKMDRAIDRGQWSQVLEAARDLEQKDEPSRMVVLNTDMALFKLGRGGQEMFNYEISDKPYKTLNPLAPIMRFVGAKALYYNLGKANFCYRWCMEDKVEYGMRNEYLKYMAKCALANGEYDLMRKYTALMKKTLFYKSLAERLEYLADHPEKLEDDPEFRTVLPLMAYTSQLEGDGGLLEGYLVMQVAMLKGGPQSLQELTLMCNLIQKNIERFWPRLAFYRRTIGPDAKLPKHFQEAAILYSFLERQVDYRQFGVDKDVEERFSRFIELVQKVEGMNEAGKDMAVKREFGDTFWYYYFFKNDLKTS